MLDLSILVYILLIILLAILILHSFPIHPIFRLKAFHYPAVLIFLPII